MIAIGRREDGRICELSWHSKRAPGWLHRQIGRTTFGWLLVLMYWRREDANGMFEWRGDGVWQKLDPTPHRAYFRTKLIPTLRILWLWLRLAMRRKTKTGERE